MKKLRKMLGSADSPYIVSLMRLMETQSKTTLAGWCISYARSSVLPIYESAFPDDVRVGAALEAAQDWLDGKIKLPVAKQFILAAHAAAREAEETPAAQAAARAVAQASSAIHAPSHGLGLAFYGSAAIAYTRVGIHAEDEIYDQIAAETCAKMASALLACATTDEKNPAKINWHC